MTLFYDNICPDRPQTHMLVIGIGAYPHLKGGINGQINYEWAGRNKLGQLSLPPRSARAFAEWAVDEKKGFNNPDAPLGSVDLLLSEHLQEQQGERLATMCEIEQALWDWVNRCNTHSESIAIFYFCGHGLRIGGSRLLLARDFADPNRDEFRNALHLDQMHKGIGDKCRTLDQYFFIDACSYNIIPKKSPDTAQAVFGRGDTVGQGFGIIACGPGEMTFSEEEGEISMFTDVLLTCLRGRGCGNTGPPENLWAITGRNLYSMLCEIYEHKYKQCAPFAQMVDRPRKRPVHIYKPPPLSPGVPVIISFDPEAIGRACMTLRSEDPPYSFARTTPQSAMWEVEDVPAGSYTLSVKFPAGHYQDIDDGVPIWVVPPGPWPGPQPLPLKLMPLST